MALRADVASVLVAMGFQNFVDFQVNESAAGLVLTWLSVVTQPTEAAINAFDLATAQLSQAQTAVSALLVKPIQVDALVAAIRTLALVARDEFNLHALKINAILDAVDAATSLADLKTRIAAIPDYPQRSKADIVTAMQNKATSGAADS